MRRPELIFFPDLCKISFFSYKIISIFPKTVWCILFLYNDRHIHMPMYYTFTQYLLHTFYSGFLFQGKKREAS